MKNVRRKTIEMDGAVFTIAPLTFSQLRRYSEQGADGTALFKASELVCMGLNNARNGDGDPEWTPQRVLEELDQPLFIRLKDEIAAFSGLRFTQSGEALAASEKTSTDSGAAS